MNNIRDLAYHYYNNAISYVNEGELSKALNLLNEARKIVANDVDILNLQGLTLFRLNYMQDAKLCFENSIKLSQDNDIAINYLEKLNSKSYESFRNDYEKSLDLIENNKYDGAIRYIKKCLDFDEEILDLYLIRGLCLYRQKKYDLAIAEVEKALEIDKSNIKAFKYLNIFKMRNKHDKKKLVITIVIVVIISLCSIMLIFNVNRKLKSENNNYQLALEEYKALEKNKETKYDEKLNIAYDLGIKVTDSNKQELMDAGLNKYSEKNIDEAIKYFNNIYMYSTDSSYVEQSCFYLAASYESQNNGIKALEYYDEYIKEFKNGNYYNEALYNASLLAYEIEDLTKSKLYATTIKEEAQNSIYNNNKIDYIFDK